MSADSTSQPGPGSAPAAGSATTTTDSATSKAGPVDEFELTPELVEEEAIRGDFMLRWAVILLALLLGWTVVSDTLTLVRIRSGEYMASHGVLPPRVDVFSTAAEGKEWVNFGWLGDLILAGVYRVGGEYGLTILSALLAAVTFRCVVQTSLTGVSTWWGSLVAMLGAVACFPHLTPNSIWTLLGVAITCRLLQRFDDEPGKGSLWGLVPCLWLWANLDRFAFVGLGILLLWGIGRTATNLGLQDPKRVASSRIWVPIGVVCLAVMIHPWHYHVWTSPWLALGVEFPEIRQYGSVTDEFLWQWYSMLDPRFWSLSEPFILVALSTAALALVTVVLNIKEVPFEHLLLLFGVNGLAVAAGYFIPSAVIVNVMIATLNAQAWYRRSFSQEYSVNALSLAYSRGGRALTVLAVFGMAYLAITGWLMGASGRRVGVGFDQDLTSNISSYRQVMSAGPDVDEKRPFNFRAEQGDLLIWVGYKPFVDRRLTLFAAGDENLLELHRQTRMAINPSSGGGEAEADREKWQETFTTNTLNLALPRLSGATPDYDTFVTMLLQPQDWYPVTFGAATASFYWRNGEHAITGFIENGEGFDPIRDAFQNAIEGEPDVELHWPSEPTFTDKYLLLPDPAIPNGIQLARHFDALLHADMERVPNPTMRLAMAYLAVREARRGLSENPNIAEGWRILSRNYLEIFNQELVILSNFGGASPFQMRLHQAIGAMQLATVCQPDQARDEYLLASLLAQIQQYDLAVEHFRRVEDITGRLTTLPVDDPAYEQDIASITEFIEKYSEEITTAEQRVDEGFADGVPPVEIAMRLQSVGLPAAALRIMESDLPEVVSHPAYRTAWCSLLMQNGRIEDAWTESERMSPAYSDVDALPVESLPAYTAWANSTALANLLGGDSNRAIELWDEASHPQLRQGLLTTLTMSPLVDRQTEAHGAWGAFRSNLIAQVALQETEQWVANQWLAASAEIEANQTDRAAERLRFILERSPQTVYRPLIAIYLSLLTNEDIYLVPDVELPIWEGMFAEDAPASEPPPMTEPDESSTPDAPESTEPTADNPETESATSEPSSEETSPNETPSTEPLSEDGDTSEGDSADEADTHTAPSDETAPDTTGDATETPPMLETNPE